MATRSTLSVVASAVRAAQPNWEMIEADAGFDGGEFSGPAHDRANAERVAAALSTNGWTAGEYNAELEARTSARYAHESGLGVDEPDDDDRSDQDRGADLADLVQAWMTTDHDNADEAAKFDAWLTEQRAGKWAWTDRYFPGQVAPAADVDEPDDGDDQRGACDDWPCCGHEAGDCNGGLYGTDEQIKQSVYDRLDADDNDDRWGPWDD